MKIDKNTINKIARLSRIKLDDKESEDYIKDLNSILDWVEQLNEVNTENKLSQLVRDFNTNLKVFFGKPSVLWDERFSSDVIFKEMRKSDLSKSKIKGKLDQQAASYILQGYLDRYRNN